MIEQYAVNIQGVTIGGIEMCRRLLSPEKARRVDRFRFDADKVRCTVGEALVRYLTVQRYGVPNGRLQFAYAERGKPYFTGDAAAVHFNLSHAGDWVVCAIGPGPLGIDVEHVKDRKVTFASAALSEGEYARWCALPEDRQSGEFYRLWTMKESYSKLLGVGLSLGFPTVDVIPDQDGFFTIAQDDSCVLYTQMLTPLDPVTVCAERARKQELDLKIRFLDAETLERFAQAEAGRYGS